MASPTIVIGLGNPGSDYKSTRHNLGFWTVERLASRHGAIFRRDGILRRNLWFARTRIAGIETVLAKPRTYMNRSGRAARDLCRTYGALPAELVVVHDDADLALGRIRTRRGGGAGGHNGVRSLIDVLGESGFTRIRLGVRGAGRDERELADYLLEPFEAGELPIASALAETGADAVESLLEHGLQRTMNRFNGIDLAAPEGADGGDAGTREPD